MWTSHLVNLCRGVGSEARCSLLSGPQSGILTSLLVVAAFICTIFGGLLADFLLSRKLLRLMSIRKLFTAIGKDEGDGDGCGRLRTFALLLSVPVPLQGFSSHL